ncbi:hypothetical protein [Streptomyces sp. CdTB01]|uniref:hypothetical protein n=1 Tax=Streptomyces sp. CdTB01 TaxID=1725411 RepID=UPI00073AE2D4|nr:hypothetical protein [Streptomyces sp. CdTB01]ALV39352.1 hypothetical protein AS200_45555 [Streptomyces sp. CdTB01]
MSDAPEQPAHDSLPIRDKQAALKALPTFPETPSEVNLFGVPHGEVVDRRFDPGRLHRIRVVDQTDAAS